VAWDGEKCVLNTKEKQLPVFTEVLRLCALQLANAHPVAID
jgi:hypothetical protein